MNNLIKQELSGRLENAINTRPKLPKKLLPLLEYYENQQNEAVTGLLLKGIAENVTWEEPMQALIFSWFYDGRDKPLAVANGYKSLNKAPDLSDYTIGENREIRDDFDGGADFGEVLFDEMDAFDVAEACYPLYDFLEAYEMDDDHIDYFVNLFTARMFYSIHAAFEIWVQSKEFQSMHISYPFCVFAHNHDWSPVLVYALNEPASITDVEFKEHTLKLPEFKTFTDRIEKKALEIALKVTYLDEIKDGPNEALESAIYDLPYLRSGGKELKLPTGEIDGFCIQALSNEKRYRNISFEAFEHFLNVQLSNKKQGNFNSAVLMFLNDPDRAFKTIKLLISQNKNDAERLLMHFKNSLRWAKENDETRYDNIHWALQREEDAQAAIAKLLADFE